MSMAWVAVGTAVVGAGAGIASSQAQSNAIKKAGGAANATAAMQDATQREMFYRTLEENQPFRAAGLSALPQLQSAILGGKVDYADPNYRQMSEDEANRYRAQQVWAKIQRGEVDGFPDLFKDISGGEDAIGRIARDPNMLRAYADEKGEKLYIGPDGTITSKPPMLSAEYDYKASPSLIPQTRAYNRALASRGLSGSGQAAMGVADLAANDYDKQLARMSGLVDIGRGAASSNVGAIQNMGNNLTNIQGNLGSTQANLALKQGENRSSLYSGLGGLAGNAASTYMMGKYLMK